MIDAADADRGAAGDDRWRERSRPKATGATKRPESLCNNGRVCVLADIA